MILSVTSILVTNRFSAVRLVHPAPHLTRRFRSRITRNAVTITSGRITYILTALSRMVYWISLQGRGMKHNVTFSLCKFCCEKQSSFYLNPPYQLSILPPLKTYLNFLHDVALQRSVSIIGWVKFSRVINNQSERLHGFR